jgi:MEDS: MEthanogen/methylotroph, DcmR Sensory domain
MTSMESWHPLLRSPHPCDHVVQLYTDEGFLVRALGLYVGAGLVNGEGAVVVGTPEHVAALTERLGPGIDVAGALACDRLVLLDARTSLAGLMVGGRIDRTAFFTLVNGVLDRVRAAGHQTIRLFGEMVNLLWEENLPATLELEALWGEVLAERPHLSLLCAYRLDNFDHHLHRGLLHRISRSHSHLVPVEDYARLDTAVDRAYRDVFGDRADTARLRSLLVKQPSAAAAMPAAQAALVALRDVRGDIADDVLARARFYYERSA